MKIPKVDPIVRNLIFAHVKIEIQMTFIKYKEITIFQTNREFKSHKKNFKNLIILLGYDLL